jgi:glycosyltransferase involved in cell wall biosynthesis
VDEAITEVIFPCLNEEQALPGVLDALPPGFRAIVVDNGCTDRSADIARAHGARVVVESRRGYGAAVQAGLVVATAPIVAVCDADGSFNVDQLHRVVDPIVDRSADLVLGRRRPTTLGAWPVHARIANAALAGILRTRTGVPVHDLGPMRAARRAGLLALELEDRRSGYPLEVFLKASAAGWRIREVDVDYSPRLGKSKVTGTVRGTVTAVKDMRRQLSMAAR